MITIIDLPESKSITLSDEHEDVVLTFPSRKKTIWGCEYLKDVIKEQRSLRQCTYYLGVVEAAFDAVEKKE